MPNNKLTVSSKHRTTLYGKEIITPYVRITNRKLNDCGFKVGDSFQIDYQPGRIVLSLGKITKIVKKEKG